MPKAKRKTAPKPKRSKAKSQLAGRNDLLASPVLRRLILVVVIMVLLYLFVPSLIGLGAAAWQGSLELFGAGLVILVAALGVLVWVVWRGFSVLGRHWNWFLGGAILALALWGVFSFFSPAGGILWRVTLGGKFGQSIIGAPDIIGGLRIAGLVLLGIIFIAPHKFWHGLKNAFKGGRRPVAKPAQLRPKVAPATDEAISVEAGPRVARAGARPAATSPPPAVASELWRSQREPILTPSGWQLPPIDILDKPVEVELNRDDVNKRARLIEEALTSYGVEASVVEINMGPTVT